jgi:hypothetical protein
MNVLEQISELCDIKHMSDQLRIQQIKSIAKLNAKMLTETIRLIRQNQDEPTYRKARLKAAQRMLGSRHDSFPA